MAPPSPLAIATSSLLRLVKEEKSYHKELLQQEARVQRLVNNQDESVDKDNVEFLMNQERKALAETKAVFPPLRQRIVGALAGLEDQIQAETESGKEGSREEITKARDAVAAAQKSIRESAAA